MRKLTSEEIHVRCEEKEFACRTSSELFPLENIVGQKRALEALRFGLMIRDKGFNVYVAGIPGTGRTTAVSKFVRELATKRSNASDWCYVTNFEDQYYPRALELPSSRGWQLELDMESFIELARISITQMLESDEYIAQKEELVREFKNKQQEIGGQMEEEARNVGFVLQGSQTGLVILPVVDGTPLSPELLANMPEKVRGEIETRRIVLEKEMRMLFRQMRILEREIRDELQKMERNAVLYTLSPLLDDVEEKYRELPRVTQWIQEVAGNITENLHDFIGLTAATSSDEMKSSQTSPIPPEEFALRYKVNLIVDNVSADGAPVVIVANPSYSNLFGAIEKEPRYGGLRTDFSMIRPGALHEANGGYLVIPAREILSSPYIYQALKRALEHSEIVIEHPPESGSLYMVKSLRPEPIPLDVKVILIGEDAIYRELNDKDPEFRQLFKVKAEFDTVMDRTPENINIFGSFICMIHQKAGIRPLLVDAIAEVIDYSSRLAGSQAKLSIRFDIIADIIREANFYAGEAGSVTIEKRHVKQALNQRLERLNLHAEKVRELVENNIILVDLEGEAVGQINGLSIVTLGGHSFGQTSRVTASISPGYGRVIDIERESNLGGPIHTKGVLILGGYLANKFGKNKPISLSARIVFEQSYGGIDGDSASSAELFAVLSALSGVPVQQSFAVTGSVNQHGRIQAVGGINEKIDGYFELCKAKGLTGEHAILIPQANIQNLMLADEVVEAVRSNMFHIYAIENVDEGIELLTGVSAGQRQENGTYPHGTINAFVDECLFRMAKIMEKHNSPLADQEVYP
ncbi:MAG: Lon protease family protein [Candidatus Thorarchaeota archaeon]|jgi:lon-related putative ATP-dependent protease